MRLAINQATTMKNSFQEDMAAYSKAGFEAVELWLDKVFEFLKKESIQQAKIIIDDNGLKPVGACFHFGVMLSSGQDRTAVIDEFKKKLEVCQALGVPILVVPTDFPEKNVAAEDYNIAVDGFKQAAEIARDYQISLAVEFVKGAKLIGTLDTALQIVRRSEVENAGILLDTFHLYAGASKIEHISNLKENELLLVHINDLCDMPVEIAEDKHRVLPGEGVLPLKQIISAVNSTAYKGYFSVELFNEELWRKDLNEAAGEAFRKTSSFLEI